MSEKSLAKTGLAKAGNSAVPFDQLATVDARIDDLADDMRRDGVRRMIVAVVVGSLAPVAIFLASIRLHDLPGLLEPLGSQVPLALSKFVTPSISAVFVAISIVLALLHFTLDTRARQRQNKAALLLIKSDVLSARLAAGYPQQP